MSAPKSEVHDGLVVLLVAGHHVPVLVRVGESADQRVHREPLLDESPMVHEPCLIWLPSEKEPIGVADICLSRPDGVGRWCRRVRGAFFHGATSYLRDP